MNKRRLVPKPCLCVSGLFERLVKDGYSAALLMGVRELGKGFIPVFTFFSPRLGPDERRTMCTVPYAFCPICGKAYGEITEASDE